MKPLVSILYSSLFALTVSFSLSAAEQVTETMKLGDSIKELKTEMQTTSGKAVTIEKAQGKNGTLVVFTCNHCPYVKKWQDRMTTLGNAYLKKGVGVIAINSNDSTKYPEDGLEGMKTVASGKSKSSALAWDFPYAVDATSNIARAYGASKTPEFFLFNKAGKLVYHGALDADADDASLLAYEGDIAKPIASKQFLRNALEELLAGKPVSQASTQAFGCGIKFRKSSS